MKKSLTLTATRKIGRNDIFLYPLPISYFYNNVYTFMEKRKKEGEWSNQSSLWKFQITKNSVNFILRKHRFKIFQTFIDKNVSILFYFWSNMVDFFFLSKVFSFALLRNQNMELPVAWTSLSARSCPPRSGPISWL